MIRLRTLFLLTFVSLLGCTSSLSEGHKGDNGDSYPTESFDIQGHRGARGLMPENSIPGFIHALALGVTTLEMDVVISQDSQVVLSHEPWLSQEICLNSLGDTIEDHFAQDVNIFQLPYSVIKSFDCGSKFVESFPSQEKIKTYKPLLEEVIDTVEAYLKEHGGTVYYNIETKCSPRGDNSYHPEPETFVSLLTEVLKRKGIEDRVVIQSFDIRTLMEAREVVPEVKLALLIGGDRKDPIETQIDQLGFVPEYYSPNWKLVTSELVEYLHGQNVKVIPWTVNEKEDMRRLLELGVDGIISDYPDRLIEVVEGAQ